MDYNALASGASIETSVAQMAAMAGVLLLIMMASALFLGLLTLPLFFGILWVAEKGLMLIEGTGLLIIKIALLLLRSLQRNIFRTSLSYFALFILTFVLSGLYTIVEFLRFVTAEKSSNIKVILTEKYSIPSMMPPGYVDRVERLLSELPPEYRPPGDEKTIGDNVMSWSFVGANTDPSNRRPENDLFLFSLEPRKILTMMDGLERKDLDEKELAIMDENIKKMEEDPQAIIVSKTRLEKLKMQIGDRVRFGQLGIKENVFEFNIVGMIPEGKFEGVAMMNRQYLNNQMQAYERRTGTAHPLASKVVNLIWVRLPNKAAYERFAELVNEPKNFSGPEVKVETSSAFIGNIMEGFKDIVWAMKYLLSPTMVVIMALVIAIAISIGVRERRTELAVFKVLGFRPWHVMAMVLCEALLIGFLSCGMSVFCFKILFPVIKVPIGIFGAFPTPNILLLYGPLMGMFVSFIGSFMPALSAKNVKAVEVFTKVG